MRYAFCGEFLLNTSCLFGLITGISIAKKKECEELKRRTSVATSLMFFKPECSKSRQNSAKNDTRRMAPSWCSRRQTSSQQRWVPPPAVTAQHPQHLTSPPVATPFIVNYHHDRLFAIVCMNQPTLWQQALEQLEFLNMSSSEVNLRIGQQLTKIAKKILSRSSIKNNSGIFESRSSQII